MKLWPQLLHIYLWILRYNKLSHNGHTTKAQYNDDCHSYCEAATGAPGETLSFKVIALDQAGNKQPAVWSIAEDNENEVERQVLPCPILARQYHVDMICSFV